jgi:triosephosphate isomerase
MAKSSSLVVFNWKENPRTERAAIRLFSAISKAVSDKRRGDIEVVACPPVVYLKELSEKLAASRAHFSLGAQDISWENAGAYTGGIGPAMLKQFGVGHVIIGHSERRRVFGETDEMVNKKVRAAFTAGLRVILCVGEPAEVRKKGIRAARQYVKNQLKKDLGEILNLKFKILNLIVAYEPIWAIGTGKNDPPEDARDMVIFIKKETRDAVVLYGGSVDSANVADYLCYHEIGGVLVGGASLHAGEIKKIIKNIS